MSIIKRIGQVIGVLILISVFWSIFIGNNETPTGKVIQEETKIAKLEITTTPKETASPSEIEKEIKTANIGEKIIVDDISYMVNNVKTFVTLGNYFKEKADGVFYVIDLTIENIGKETQNIFSSRFKLIDDQGRIFDEDSEAKYKLNNPIDFGEQIHPNLPIKGTIVFDLPKDAKGLKLEIKGDWLSVEKVLVDLGK